MPKTTESAVSEVEITLDDFANRKLTSHKHLLVGIAAFCRVHQGVSKQSFEAWDAIFNEFMNSPAE